MGKRKKEVPAEETKAQRFKRVIEPRVNKAIKAIRLVGSVSGSTYEHTNEQAAAIVTALQTEIDAVEKRLSGKVVMSGGFSL